VSDTASADHLEPRLVAAYAAGTLDASERERIERHLSQCRDCVAEVVAIHRIGRPRRWPLLPLVTGGLAAAAALAIYLGVAGRTAPTPADDIRGAESPSVLRFDAVAPADGAVLGDSGFVWRAIADAVTYRLTITDDAGDELWSQTTSDTAATRPRSVRLLAGRTYFWYIDALKGDGTSATSGVRRFQIGE
jgi:anti-sigma factor RsiW